MGVSALQVAVLNRRLRNKVTDQILRSIKLLMYLKKKGRMIYNVGGDAGVDFYVQYRNSGTGARTIGDFTELTGRSLDNWKELTAPWAKYGDALSTSKLQEKRTKNADDADVNFKWLVNQMSAFKQQFIQTLGTDLYGQGTVNAARGDTTTPLIGLAGGIDDDNTLYGEDRSTSACSYLRSYVGSTTDFFGDDNMNDECNGLEKMKQCWNQASKGKQAGDNVNDTIPDQREEPQLTLSDQTSYEMYENALAPRMRITTQAADAALETLTFKMKPYEWDPFCGLVDGAQVQQQFFLNLDHISVQCVEDNQLLSVYAEDETNLVKSVIIATQLLALYEKPSTSARHDITG